MNVLEQIKDIISSFSERRIRISIAESCTGGFVCHMITNVSGASEIFERGIVSYSNRAKIELLRVKSEDIKEHGAVSEVVAEQMARNVRTFSGVDIGIGITGIAGPTGGTEGKPVGLVFVGFSTVKETTVQKHVFRTRRIDFKVRVLKEILSWLRSYS